MPNDLTQGFTPEDDIQLQNLLTKWADAGGGPFADKTFASLAYALPQTAVIVVATRNVNDKLEVLFIPRPAGDPTWPGMIHLPGTMIRRGDFLRPDNKVINGPLERLQKGELGIKFGSEPKFVSCDFKLTKRGPEIALVYLVEFSNKDISPAEAMWIKMDEIKKNTNVIPTELPHIESLLKYYRENY